MQISTSGIQIRSRQGWLRETVELISSMRFAISLLTVLAIASVIGTVLAQNQPFTNYVNQFGSFWFEIFRVLGLYSVYNTPWFLVVLGFLVLSTSLCVIRNTPRMLRDMRAWRDHVREESLGAFHHHNQYHSALSRSALAERLSVLITRHGYRTKILQRGDEATLIVAKTGTWNRLGYIFAHSAIVVICLGGLLDSELPVKAQILFFGKQPVSGDTLIRNVPPSGRLAVSNPTFRGNAFVPEGNSIAHAVLNYRDRALIQELPFTLTLRKFIVEYYSTGMPKLFASDVTITDHDTGKSFDATIKVNQPLIHQGIAIYQSSFEDGGSKLKLIGWPMQGSKMYSFPIQGEVGQTTPLAARGDMPNDTLRYAVEFTDFRPINVENVAQAGKDLGVAVDTRLRDNVAAVLGSAAHSGKDRDLRNVGPLVQYKLRDATGQAREFSNYMLPVDIDGDRVFLAGVRDNPNENFSYLRIPADAQDSLGEFMRLRAALADPSMRQQAAQRFADKTLPGSADAPLRTQLAASAIRALETFAGADDPPGQSSTGAAMGGYTAIAAFIDRTVRADEQQNAAGILLKMLGSSIWELWQVARESEGLPDIQVDEHSGRFLQLAMNALSDSFFYGAPVYLQLDQFEHVQASVFQMTRSPGRNIVYLGCLLLVAGIFTMFYIREKRLWAWLKDDPGSGTRIVMAMSATRRSPDFDQEFARLDAAFGAASQISDNHQA